MNQPVINKPDEEQDEQDEEEEEGQEEDSPEEADPDPEGSDPEKDFDDHFVRVASNSTDYDEFSWFLRDYLIRRGVERMPAQTAELFNRFYFFGVFPYLP